MRDGQISVLVIEDEADIRQLLRTLLEREGYSVAEALEGRDGVRQFHQSHPDIVILDVGLPDLDGWQVLERIRDMSDVPVLMLTALGTERDKVRGLNSGADDYLTKPFSRVELLARLQAVGRRQVSKGEPVTTFDDGTLHIDFAHQEVTIDSTTIILTPTEYRLLATLARHQGQVLSSDQLIELAWDDPSGLAPSRVKYAVSAAPAQVGLGRGRRGPHRDGPGVRIPLPLAEPVNESAQSQPDADRRRDPQLPGSTLPIGFSGSMRVRLPVFALVAVGTILIALVPFPHDARREISIAGVIFFCLVAAAFLLPWERLPDWAWLIIPIGYIAVIAIIRDAQGGADSGLVVVYLLPIVWLSLYGRRLHLLVGLFCIGSGPAHPDPARRSSRLPHARMAPGGRDGNRHHPGRVHRLHDGDAGPGVLDRPRAAVPHGPTKCPRGGLRPRPTRDPAPRRHRQRHSGRRPCRHRDLLLGRSGAAAGLPGSGSGGVPLHCRLHRSSPDR